MPERSNHDMNRGHVPVLLDETMELLAPKSGGRYIDATFGGGGHTRAILERSAPDGEVLALDADPAAIERAAELATEFGNRLTYRHNNFGDIAAVSNEAGFQNVDGVLFDLGLSSFQFDEHERGFSLHADVPLDMRLNPSGAGPTAQEIVNEWDEASIVDILFRFGEENRARRIVRGILRQRDEAPIQTNRQLAELIETSVGGRRGARIHPATKTFQALRIAVNRELDVLKSALGSVLGIVRSGGRIVVISFHSLEDRIVKQFFQQEARDCLCPPDLPVCRCDHQAQVRILTRRPITASEAERTMNPRSRSAKLRAAERI